MDSASDHLCKASEAVQRTVTKSRKLPGWDLATEVEVLQIGTRLLEIAQGVDERASESA